MKYGSQTLWVKRIYTQVDVWIDLKMLSSRSVKVEAGLFGEYTPTLFGWVWWLLSWLGGICSVDIQCYEPSTKLSTEACTAYTMMHWVWASHGTIRELVHCANRVQEGERLIALGTSKSSRMGAEGFSLYPCIVHTSLGQELRRVASFELPKVLEQDKDKGRVWFLEIPPS